jgi:phosphate-selective porin OprO and OprP
MRIKSHRCGIKTGILLALCAAAPVPAIAQSAEVADRIDAIEKKIRGLQGQLQQLKSELGEARKQLRQSRGGSQRWKEQARQTQQAVEQAGRAEQGVPARDAAANDQSQPTQAVAKAVAAPVAAPSGGGVIVAMPGGRPTISTADGRASLAIGTQVQFDMGGYFQNPSPTTQFPDLNSGVNLRRARIFFVGKYDDFTLNVTPDFADPSPTLYEANINYTGFKPVVARVGYFQPWYTLYDSQSSNDFLQLERPSIIEISRNLAAGDARASVGFKASTDGWFFASYLTGATYGENSTSLNGEQLGFVGRMAGRPYYDKDWNINVGFSGESVFHPNLRQSGTPFVSQETLTLEDRPELRIDQNRLISTGALSASGANSYGGGMGINWQNFLVQGEFYQIQVNQLLPPGARSPVLGFNGGYVEGGWVITGEPVRYNAGSAAFARPKVAEPFSLGGALGAWELSARYSTTNLNSNVTPGVAQSVTGGVFGGYQQVYGVALSWYPNDWVRLMLQFQYTSVNRLNSAGTVQIGQKFETLAGRMQVAF